MKNRKHHRQQQKWLCICIREVLARSRLVRLPQHEISDDRRPPRHRPATEYPTTSRCEQAGKRLVQSRQPHQNEQPFKCRVSATVLERGTSSKIDWVRANEDASCSNTCHQSIRIRQQQNATKSKVLFYIRTHISIGIQRMIPWYIL